VASNATAGFLPALSSFNAPTSCSEVSDGPGPAHAPRAHPHISKINKTGRFIKEKPILQDFFDTWPRVSCFPRLRPAVQEQGWSSPKSTPKKRDYKRITSVIWTVLPLVKRLSSPLPKKVRKIPDSGQSCSIVTAH
jgi:hypothetical protein